MAAEQTRKRTGTGNSIVVEDVMEEDDDKELIEANNKTGQTDSDTSDDEGSLIRGRDGHFFTVRTRHVPWRTRYFTSR